MRPVCDAKSTLPRHPGSAWRHKRLAPNPRPYARAVIRPADLRSPATADLAALLAAQTESDPLARIAAVRRACPAADPALVAAVATQQRLRDRARASLGLWADRLILSDAGLQQSTRAAVARYRAASLRERLGRENSNAEPVGFARVADLGCGLGIDALALAEAGFTVDAVERDDWTAEAAAMNAEIADGRMHVHHVDAMTFDVTGCAAAFCDPARRDPDGPANRQGTRTRREIDPEQWSPPWSWIVALAGQLPVVAKVAPGIRASAVPGDAEIEWIAVDGDLVEACVWFAPLARQPRRATEINDVSFESLSSADSGIAPYAPVGAYLLEPSSAVRRADLVDALALRLGSCRVSAESAWLTAEQPASSLLARSWRVVAEVPKDPTKLRAHLADRGSATWKTRDLNSSAEDIDRKVRHRPARGGVPVTVAWLRIGGASRAFEVEPVPSPSNAAEARR